MVIHRKSPEQFEAFLVLIILIIQLLDNYFF